MNYNEQIKKFAAIYKWHEDRGDFKEIIHRLKFEPEAKNIYSSIPDIPGYFQKIISKLKKDGEKFADEYFNKRATIIDEYTYKRD